jgi:hypothetical protein
MSAVLCEARKPAKTKTLTSLAKLRAMPRREFVEWAVHTLGGRLHNDWRHARGFHGHIVVSPSIYHNSDNPPFQKCRWYAIQVRQKDKIGCPDIYLFEAMMMREDCDKGFFVGFNFSSDALLEIDKFFKRTKKIIIALTVREILDEEIARKLA